MSNTYTREKQARAFRHLQESSSGIVDYRSRLIFIKLLKKHPNWDMSFIKAVSDTQALFITIFQKPLVWLKGLKMKRKLRNIK